MLLKLGPNDWQSEQVPRIEKQVGTLWVDETEVSNEQWSVCAETNACPIKPLSEPGQPVANLTVEDAQRFCAANGGRLPTLEERIALSAGGDSRRYPWGQTGLVCRRAVFGVKHGPCAEGGTQPDVTGGHAAGRSSDGLFDLSGNVAELAIDAQQRAWACGGSFRSTTALELKSWACALFLGATDDVGFRCVYDPKAEPAR
jgi:formylglycine-generating enzyme required for sulfatase activity